MQRWIISDGSPTITVDGNRHDVCFRACVASNASRRSDIACVARSNHTIFPKDGKPAHSLAEIIDGTSNSLLIMEACGTRIVWTNPQDIDVDSATPGINLPGHEPGPSDGIMSSHHTGGAQVAMADGSVRFISADTDLEVLKALLTVDGKEEVSDY